MKKQLPVFESDAAAEAFVADSDLTEYDLSGFKYMRFEFEAKDERVNMRLPKPLLDAVKEKAAKVGLPYQRYIRQILEGAVTAKSKN